MTIYPVIRSYSGNRLTGEIRLPFQKPTSAFGVGWLCDVNPTGELHGMGDSAADITFTVLGGEARSAGVAVAFEFDDWSDGDYLFFPAAVYQGNDFELLETPYPPLWRDPSLFRPDMPVTTTDVPTFGRRSRKLEQTTGDTASPCMGFYSPSRRTGFLVQTTQESQFGNHGLTAERTDSGGIRFLITAPCVREIRFDHCKPLPSDDLAVDWMQGDRLTLRFRRILFEADSLQELFQQYASLRKCLFPAGGPREELPFSAAWKTIEEKYNRDNWLEDHGYYKLAPNNHTTFEIAEDPLCFLWQLGWVGGGMMTLPMLADGSPTTRERAWRNLEMIFGKTQAPSGFFFSSGDGQRFFSDSFDRPHPHQKHLLRKSGDWLYFALKQFDLLRKQRREIPPAWEQSIRRLADAFVRLFDESGQFGQFVNVMDGKLLIGGSASAGVVPAGLALAARWYSNPDYLRVAEAAARDYYQNFILNGLTTGGPGEILSAPDSESAFALLESFVVLLETTGDSFYAKAARETAAQVATWVVSYDYRFPATSSLGRAGTRSTGAVFANVQNKHAAPGICTWSGDSLFRLWRATGDPLALDLIHDIARGIPQYVSRADKPLSPAMHEGWMCERVNLSDWETAAGVGGCLFGSCSWAETSMMLTAWEIPGIYIQPDTGVFHVFDHVTARRVDSPDGKMALAIANPTAFDAEVKIHCEPSSATSIPLGPNALFDSYRLAVPSGAEVVITCAEGGIEVCSQVPPAPSLLAHD